MAKGYIAFELSDADRNSLSTVFPPNYSRWIGHHVTYKFGVSDAAPLPVQPDAKVVGYANSNDGVECLVVAVNGSTVRPDGRIYHITWSLSDGRKPVESNNLLKSGFTKLDSPIPVTLTPKFFSF